jgi:hypothetical protein
MPSKPSFCPIIVCGYSFCVLALKLKGWDLPPAAVNKPTNIVFSWKGDGPEWFPKESSSD